MDCWEINHLIYLINVGMRIYKHCIRLWHKVSIHDGIYINTAPYLINNVIGKHFDSTKWSASYIFLILLAIFKLLYISNDWCHPIVMGFPIFILLFILIQRLSNILKHESRTSLLAQSLSFPSQTSLRHWLSARRKYIKCFSLSYNNSCHYHV